MKKLFFGLLLAMFITAASLAERQLGVDEYTSLEELAAAISSFFPKVQGEVKTAQGDTLSVALGRKDGLVPGTALTLWREGKDITHPVTGAVIGRMEEEIGSVEVASAGDTSSIAVVQKRIKDPRPGDKARITPKKINMALVPVRAERSELVAELSRRLSETGRFAVLDSVKAEPFLKDRKERDAELVRDMGRAFGLDAVASVGIYPSEGKMLVTVKVFYTVNAKLLNTVVAMLDLSSKTQPLGDVSPFFAPVKEKAESAPLLPFRARYMSIADLEGDGKYEYVFSDGARLYVYRLEPSGWHEIWTEAAPPANKELRHLYLEAADINNNGRAEIFITAMSEGRAVSWVVEQEDGAFRRIAELAGFLSVLRYPGRGTVLMWQGYDSAEFFSGRPRQYAWSHGKYEPGAELELPTGVNLYGFAFVDFGETSPMLVSLDEKDRLLVYSRDTLVWKSEERYLNVDTFVYKPLTGLDAAVSKAAEDDKTRRVRIKGRVRSADIDGDGREEIIIAKNTKANLLGGYKEAELHGMGWTGARLEQKRAVKAIPGAVLDFQVVRPGGRAGQIFALVRSSGGLFSKDSVRVISYSTD